MVTIKRMSKCVVKQFNLNNEKYAQIYTSPILPSKYNTYKH